MDVGRTVTLRWCDLVEGVVSAEVDFDWRGLWWIEIARRKTFCRFIKPRWSITWNATRPNGTDSKNLRLATMPLGNVACLFTAFSVAPSLSRLFFNQLYRTVRLAGTQHTNAGSLQSSGSSRRSPRSLVMNSRFVRIGRHNGTVSGFIPFVLLSRHRIARTQL